ncbi:hypothetical protein ACVBEQ_05205 [Nakamurella sp. GG22]
MRYQVLGAAVMAVAYAAFASRFTPLTWPAMLATVPPAAGVFWIGVRTGTVRDAPAVVFDWSRLVPWVVVAALGIALEIVALVQSPREDFPTLSSLISPFAGDSTGWYRFGGYLAWFALGTWLARR